MSILFTKWSKGTKWETITLKIAFVLFLLFPTNFVLQGQSLFQFTDYHISCPSGSFAVGDDITYKVDALSNSTQTITASKINIEIHLSSHAEFPTALTPDFSALGPSYSNLNSLVQMDPIKRTIRIIAQSPTGAFLYSGNVFSFQLKSASSGIGADQLLLAGGGIIITIDEVDLREGMSFDQNQSNLRIYPNPTKDKIIIDSKDQELDSIEIIDLQGRSLTKTSSQKVDFKQLELAPGRYYLRSKFKSGQYLLKSIQYMGL